VDRFGQARQRQAKGTPTRSQATTAPALDAQGAGERRLTLGELTDTAGVSVRTVRYYIAEGLLPPPDGAGPASAYRAGHLDRLRLIQRMKDAYLPLKEIRRRLAGLDDAAVREALTREEALAAGHEDAQWDASLAGARDYLALMETRQAYRTEPLPLDVNFEAPPAPSLPSMDHGPRPARSKPPRPSGVFPARAPQRAKTEADGEPPLWHRLRLGDEAELVISDRVYARHKDRVDWLVRWARKVFG
jgi:DNA-binding transcriptional MerR regulator